MTIKEKMGEAAKDLDHMIQEAQKKGFSIDDYFKISRSIFDIAREAGSSGVIWYDGQRRKLHRLEKLIITKLIITKKKFKIAKDRL